MKKVFLDLEFTNVTDKEFYENLHYEIIEVGAAIIDENLNIIKEFRELVKPQHSRISRYVTRLTGIDDEKVSNAYNFTKVMDLFLEWVENNGETEIYSWSITDKLQLMAESNAKEYNKSQLEELCNCWRDFQQDFDNLLGINQQLSLDNALKGVGIKFQGKEHTALSDAINTANLYILTQNEKEFKKRAGAIIEMFKPTEELTFNLSSLIPKEFLNQTQDDK